MGWLSQAVSAGAGYLPAQVADVLAQGRAYASARLPHTGYRAVAAITNVSRGSGGARLLVATSQGVLYVYALDAAEGGVCALLRQHRFLEPPGTAAHHTTEESERDTELGAALEPPAEPRGGFDLRDPRHFPPIAPSAAGALAPLAPLAP